MAPSIQNVAIITKIGSREAEAAANRVARLLNKNKVKIYSVLPLLINGAIQVRQEELKGVKLDLVFAIGADGPTLRAFRPKPGRPPLLRLTAAAHGGKLL